MVLGYLYAQRRLPPFLGPAWMKTLSPPQSRELEAIWKSAGKKREEFWDRSRQLTQQRDQAVRGLLGDEQKAAYDKIDADYHAARAAIDKEREQIRIEVERQTRELLTEEQKAKFDADRAEHRRRSSATQRSATQKSATQPVTQLN